MAESREWREGDRVTGECATDLPGPRTGTYVGHHSYETHRWPNEGRAITKILDERDGTPSFVWTDTLRPAQEIHPSDSRDVLRTAAAQLREMAAKATPGPWQACEPWTTGGEGPRKVQTVTSAGYPNDDVAGWAIDTEDAGFHGGIEPGNAAWIAALSPAVAEPLAAWLEYERGKLDAHLPHWGSHPGGIDEPPIVRTPEDTQALVEYHFKHPLAFARAITEGA